MIATLHAIADTGATSIFVMDGVDVANKQIASKPLTINLPDGRKVQSTQVCNIAIPGLPNILMGHIVLALALALLMGIRLLCKAGCRVIFDSDKCDVEFDGNIVLRGYKDPSTDLWTLPITPDKIRSALSRSSPVFNHAPDPNSRLHSSVQLALFMHFIRTRGKGIKFTHQSLCNPKVSTLLKAVRKGFLKRCPNLSEKLILKYLNPSPATAKGHRKHPHHGIWNTQPMSTTPSIAPVPIVPPLPLHVINHAFPAELHPDIPRPALIHDDTDESIANIYCFGAFADQHSGIIYNDLTGNFPFMSYDGSVCYHVVYHYKSNTILALPISGLDDKTIFDAYKIALDELAAKGFKPKLNILDNQTTKYVEKFLTKEECKLQLVESHNHRVNAAKRAIQMFKDAFIATLALQPPIWIS
jgi:hypothetical protein